MRREYPEAPIIGVGAVVIDGAKVLLIRRGQEPLKGEWSLPGGALELGETLQQAVVREVLEETGLMIVPAGHCGGRRQDHAGRGLGMYSLPLCADRLPVPRDRGHTAGRQRCGGGAVGRKRELGGIPAVARDRAGH